MYSLAECYYVAVNLFVVYLQYCCQYLCITLLPCISSVAASTCVPTGSAVSLDSPVAKEADIVARLEPCFQVWCHTQSTERLVYPGPQLQLHNPPHLHDVPFDGHIYNSVMLKLYFCQKLTVLKPEIVGILQFQNMNLEDPKKISIISALFSILSYKKTHLQVCRCLNPPDPVPL